MEYYIEDLIDMIKKDNDVNFIGLALTSHQTDGIDASLKYLKQNGVEPKGYILILAHYLTGRGISKNDFLQNSEKIKFIDFRLEFKTCVENTKVKIKNRILAIDYLLKKHDGKDLYIIATNAHYLWLALFTINIPNRNIKFILIDDGTGSYLNNYRNQRSIGLMSAGNNRSFFKDTILSLKVIFRSFFSKILDSMLAKQDRIIDNRLYTVKNQNSNFVIVNNTSVVKYYKQTYTEKATLIDINVKDALEGCILINTQCLEENQIVSNREDYFLYDTIIRQLKAFHYNNIVIKMHPRESDIHKYDFFDVTVLPKTAKSQEEILTMLDNKPLCIISIYSSVLLNAYALFDIPVISLAKIFINEFPHHSMNALLHEYIRTFEKQILFPTSVRELLSIIESIDK